MQEQGAGEREAAWNKLGWDGAMMMMMSFFILQGKARRGRATMQSGLSLTHPRMGEPGRDRRRGGGKIRRCVRC